MDADLAYLNMAGCLQPHENLPASKAVATQGEFLAVAPAKSC
jgi:hypothetical protein